jgi:hypothetical protein
MTPLQRLPSRHRDPRYDAALVLAVSVSGRWWPQIVLQCVSPEGHFRDIARSGTNVCFRRKGGHVADIPTMTGFDPDRK